MYNKNNIDELNKTLEAKTAKEIIHYFGDKLSSSLALASSLGAEDQVLTYMVHDINPKIRIFVLDTERLNQETYDVMSNTQEKYNLKYDVYFPNKDAVKALVAEKGTESFYSSIENRKECCTIRKVEPLGRALNNTIAWITGLRRSQSPTRAGLKAVEWDETHNMIKLNPLYNWSEEEVWAFIKDNNIPYNILHDQGYPSIGCAPCTRAIKKGDDIRAGRWWWEDPENKECGLHFENGKLVKNTPTQIDRM
mgnify:CR=1 FL=1